MADKDVVIKFGTSGWRARVDTGEYTPDNVGRVARAVAEELAAMKEAGYKPLDGKGIRVLVAYDARPGGIDFAKRAVEVLSAYGMKADIGDDIATTPAVIAMTRESLGPKAYDLALHITASHNDARYQGIKVLQKGVVAPDSLTSSFAKRANTDKDFKSLAFDSLNITRIDIVDRTIERYNKTFPGLVEKFRKYMKDKGRGFTVDCMYGSTGPYVKLFEEMGAVIARREPMNKKLYPQGTPFVEDGQPKPYRPEPKEMFLDPKAFDSFKRGAADGDFYIALDGDGDRAACWVKKGGRVVEVSPNELGVLYGWYLHKTGRTKDATFICRTLPTTRGMDMVAKWAGKELDVTPVGSKHFAPHMVDSSSQKALVATEESGHHGIRIGQETWFDDAVCQATLLLEIMAYSGRDIVDNIRDAERDIGFEGYVFRRDNKDLTDAIKAKIIEPLSTGSRKLADAISQKAALGIDKVSLVTLDGKVASLDEVERQALKINVNEGMHILFKNGSWGMFRLSGTELVARIYTEAKGEDARRKIQDAIVQVLGLR